MPILLALRDTLALFGIILTSYGFWYLNKARLTTGTLMVLSSVAAALDDAADLVVRLAYRLSQ